MSRLSQPLLTIYECLFEPRVIEFNNKREGVRLISLNVTEEIIDHQADCVVRFHCLTYYSVSFGFVRQTPWSFRPSI
jgi:hypothetical protein